MRVCKLDCGFASSFTLLSLSLVAGSMYVRFMRKSQIDEEKKSVASVYPSVTMAERSFRAQAYEKASHGIGWRV